MKGRRFWQGERSEKQLIRELFFEEITKSAYHVNKSLRTEAYIPHQSDIPGYYTPRFEELDNLAEEYFWKTHPNSKRSNHENIHTWRAYLMADDNHYPELIPVREAVITWSRKNHLDADWCREIAVRTLDDWARIDRKSKKYEDDEEEVYEWDCPPGGGRYHLHHLVEEKLLPLPGFPPYLPFRHQSLDHYLKEVERWMQVKIIPHSIWHQLKSSFLGSIPGVSKELDKYNEDALKRIRKVAVTYAFCVELFYDQEGYKPVTSRPEEAKHIRWAVQAQVGMKTLSDIAKGENLFNGGMPNASYVRREVLKVLEAIRLAPRQGLLKRGRPKGAKSEKPCRRASKR